MQRFRDIEIELRSGFFILLAASLLLLPIPWVIGCFCAAAMHELGHLLAMRLLRVRIYSIRLDIYGAKIYSESMLPGKEMICAAAGPLFALSTLLFRRQFPHAAICAVMQSAFNLLPIYPMDGGRVLHCVCATIGGEKFSNKVSRITNMIVMPGIIICAVWFGWKYFGIVTVLPCIILCVKQFTGKYPCKVNKQIVK